MVIAHQQIFRGYGAPPEHCLPLDGGYPVLPTNPYCQNGWGWLKEGECGCFGGKTLVEPAAPGWIPEKRGCSVKCGGVGPNVCPNCPQPFNWKLWGGVGLGALAAYYLFGRK